MLDSHTYEPRLKKIYRDTIVPAMIKQFGYKKRARSAAA